MAMKTILIEKSEIILPPQQVKMIESGWGAEVAFGTKTEAIVYKSGPHKVKGYISYPVSVPERAKLPCILWNRGGYSDAGMIDQFTACGMFGQIASWGYVVLASQYRGSVPGDGEDDLINGAVEDVQNIMSIASTLPFADTDRWGMEGWSRGGFTALNLMRQVRDFKAVILSGAITDLTIGFENSSYFEQEIMRTAGDPQIIEKISPLNNVTELPKETNYLIIHGANDRTVPPMHSVNLAIALLEKGCNIKLCLLDGGDHFLRSHRKETERLRKEWFNKYL